MNLVEIKKLFIQYHQAKHDFNVACTLLDYRNGWQEEKPGWHQKFDRVRNLKSQLVGVGAVHE